MCKQDSSFSEEKEAKRLSHLARAPGGKFFLLLFYSQKRRPF
jgi:hypothetical protein